MLEISKWLKQTRREKSLPSSGLLSSWEKGRGPFIYVFCWLSIVGWMVRRGGEKQGGKRERCLRVGWMWECAILNRVIGKGPLRRIPVSQEDICRKDAPVRHGHFRHCKDSVSTGLRAWSAEYRDELLDFTYLMRFNLLQLFSYWCSNCPICDQGETLQYSAWGREGGEQDGSYGKSAQWSLSQVLHGGGMAEGCTQNPAGPFLF